MSPVNANHQRRFERIWGKVKVAIELPSGKKIWGMSCNFSLQGIFIILIPPIAEISLELPVKLTLGSHPEKVPLTGRIVRIQESGIAVVLEEGLEIVEQAVRRLLLAATQFFLGIELGTQEQFTAEVHLPEQALRLIVQVIAINARKLTALVQPLLAPLVPGTVMDLSIRYQNDPPLLLEGVALKMDPIFDEDDESPLCWRIHMIFAEMSDATMARIKNLVTEFHHHRLAALILQTSVLSMAQPSDEVLPGRAMIRQDLEGFFGYCKPESLNG